ncbi:hypothetical protein [Nocardioides sp. LML1-1-1.1]|uniref:hypothetical protein n=1 Tax=Nocardioides sp. LML1-1-1.1 TaxID=3135248 RepID=UPI003430A992
MTRPTPRRPATSRGGTQRPRKIAGQAPVPAAPASPDTTEPDATEPDATEPDATEPDATEVEQPAEETLGGAAPAPEPADDVPARRGVLARPKTTRVLIATLVLVALALTLECAILVAAKIGDDDSTASDAPDKMGVVSVPADRPVLADDLDVKAGVDAAAKAAQEIVAVDYQKFDDEVEKAADLMTARFAESYRATTADIKSAFVANKTIVQTTVVAQGVSAASRTRLQALVFLNQFVQRTRAGKAETVATPYRVLVTMVHTDNGWLVDGLATDKEKEQGETGE